MFEEVYKDDDLVLLLEWDQDLPYIHHHFYTWSLSTHKKCIAEFNKLIQTLQTKGYKELWSYYDKQNTNVDKFCNYYGFTKVGETPTQNIVLKEI